MHLILFVDCWHKLMRKKNPGNYAEEWLELRDHKMSDHSMFVIMRRTPLTAPRESTMPRNSVRSLVVKQRLATNLKNSYLKWIDSGRDKAFFPVPACTKCSYHFIYSHQTCTTMNSKHFVSAFWCWFSVRIWFLFGRSCAYLRFIKIHSIFITMFFFRIHFERGNKWWLKHHNYHRNVKCKIYADCSLFV